MHPSLLWVDTIPEKDGEKMSVYDVVFSPDGSQLVAAVGMRVLLYKASTGELINSLKGHKDTVYTVDYSRDGKRFASGGADKTVIIWTDKGEGILKYTHNGTIQRVNYNPISQTLASCTELDFGMWSQEQRSVVKHKISSKVLCSSWNNDGQYLALGMLNGRITIRDKQGAEKTSIDRNSPVWSLCWNPSKDENVDLLAVGCWDKTLSFYQLSGIQHGKDRKLRYNPCSVSYYNDGKYLLIGGSNRKASLHNKDGVRLATISDQKGWIWSVKARPGKNQVAVASDDGTISLHDLTFATVHGIYQERYAFRENMTDVIVQHLMTEQKVRIKTRDYVRKLAVYRDRLAIQLSDRLIIYELAHDNSYDMHYRVRERIHKNFCCDLLVVTSLHFELCNEEKLEKYNFSGNKEREWIMESQIRYTKVTGGGRGREGILLGLETGGVYQIFLDNPFPILLIKQTKAIRCLDISANRRKLAIVDNTGCCIVYDLVSKEMVYQESPANSVAWNSEFEEMLCVAGENQLKIKTESFPPHFQRLQGFVVGFTGSKVFTLHKSTVQTIDVPQSAPLYRYLDQKNFEKAYEVACLGVTENDWRMIAMESLKEMQFDIARKAFIRIRDMKYIELLNTLEHAKKQPDSNTKLFLAEILAFEGRYQEAAKAFTKESKIELAIQMFADLCMWENAKKIASDQSSVNIQDLVKQQAAWAEEVKDWKAAIEMHMASGNYVKVARIMGKQGMHNELVDLTKKIDLNDTRALRLCAEYLKEAGRFKDCRDIFLKINDIESLMKMYIQLQEWDDAIALSEKHKGEFASEVFVPYADWLTLRDRFDEALGAYEKAGRPDQTFRLLKELSTNAIIERRYKDAAYYHWRLSEQLLSEQDRDKQRSEAEDRLRISKAFKHSELAELYYAFHFIYSYTDEPFCSASPESLLNASCFLLNRIGKSRPPEGISKSRIFFALGKNGQLLGAYKVARFAYERLQHLTVPTRWMDSIDLALLMLQTQPFSDQDELLPVDYRSSSTNPLINSTGNGDVCVNSGHPFNRSFLTFENLPLVEFQPNDDISDEEAVKLLKQSPSTSRTSKSGADPWKETDHGDHQTMSFGDSAPPPSNPSAGGATGEELFNQAMSQQETSIGNRYKSLIVDETILRALSPYEVYVKKFSDPKLRFKFYKNMIPEVKLHFCSTCNHFFHLDDFEFEALKIGHCPFCREPFD